MPSAARFSSLWTAGRVSGFGPNTLMCPIPCNTHTQTLLALLPPPLCQSHHHDPPTHTHTSPPPVCIQFVFSYSHLLFPSSIDVTSQYALQFVSLHTTREGSSRMLLAPAQCLSADLLCMLPFQPHPFQRKSVQQALLLLTRCKPSQASKVRRQELGVVRLPIRLTCCCGFQAVALPPPWAPASSSAVAPASSGSDAAHLLLLSRNCSKLRSVIMHLSCWRGHRGRTSLGLSLSRPAAAAASALC